MHWSYAKNDFPFDVNRTRRHAPYPTFAAFDNDLQNPQNPAGAGAFWADVARNPHVLNHMIKNRQRMQDKFNEKTGIRVVLRLHPVGLVRYSFYSFQPRTRQILRTMLISFSRRPITS